MYCDTIQSDYYSIETQASSMIIAEVTDIMNKS